MTPVRSSVGIGWRVAVNYNVEASLMSLVLYTVPRKLLILIVCDYVSVMGNNWLCHEHNWIEFEEV